MASTYSTNLRLELQATGENSGTWGTRANSSVFNMVDEAFGYVEINAAGSGNITLSANNGSADESRPTILNCTGARTATGNIIVPTIEKFWLCWNNTTGGFAITFKTSAGTGISVPAGGKVLLVADGTNVLDGLTYISSLTLGAALPIASGGTGGTSASAARTALGAAASGANTDITSIAGLSTPLAVNMGGTASTTAAGALTALGAAALAGAVFTGAIDLPAFSSLAAGTTTDLGTINSNFILCTGSSATISSFGTDTAGTWRVVRFNGANTLTYNATSLILPNGGSNITTAANDGLLAISLGSGNWYVPFYQKASGKPVNVLNAPNYTSSEVSITNATGQIVSVNHGLGYRPEAVAVLHFKANQNGYVIGDELEIGPANPRGDYAMLVDSTAIRLVLDGSGPHFKAPNYSSPGGAGIQITDANIVIKIYAW